MSLRIDTPACQYINADDSDLTLSPLSISLSAHTLLVYYGCYFASSLQNLMLTKLSLLAFREYVSLFYYCRPPLTMSLQFLAFREYVMFITV